MKNCIAKTCNKKLNRKRGSEVLQTVLISGVVLVLVVTIFYPQMKKLFNNMMDKVTNWFETSGSKPFTEVVS